MEVAAPLTLAKPSWNPLRIDGTGLEPNVLLAAKLIAVCLLATNHLRVYPDEPFLPFLPFLDALRAPFPFQLVTEALLIGSALALLFNRRVRMACLLLGGVIILGVVASKAYYGNNKLFCGLFILLAGLTRKGEEPSVLRWQLAIVYAGAAINKWADPDWLSGQFFSYWAGEKLEQPLFLAIASVIGIGWAGKLMCWSTMLVESALGVGFAFRRFWPAAIWLGVLFHCSMTWFTGSTFSMFFYAMNASFIAVAAWPKGPLEAFYDGDCGFCELSRRAMARIDPGGVYVWEKLQTGRAQSQYGISNDALMQRLHVVIDGDEIRSGFAAFKRMLLANPATYFFFAAAVLASGWVSAGFRSLVIAALVAFFFPLFSPLGEAAYNWIARNRHLMMGGESCQTD
jgi:predicted DCC family thiol-disulfide oxidoreductase YuxK